MLGRDRPADGQHLAAAGGGQQVHHTLVATQAPVVSDNSLYATSLMVVASAGSICYAPSRNVRSEGCRTAHAQLTGKLLG